VTDRISSFGGVCVSAKEGGGGDLMEERSRRIAVFLSAPGEIFIQNDRRLCSVSVQLFWKLFGHVDITDESDAGDRIGEVARSPGTLA